MCPAHYHFIFLRTLLIMMMSTCFCPLYDRDVGHRVLVCDVEHTFFHFGLCERNFVLDACLLSVRTGLCTSSVSSGGSYDSDIYVLIGSTDPNNLSTD